MEGESVKTSSKGKKTMLAAESVLIVLIVLKRFLVTTCNEE